ncbi:MAG: hypothetical protein ACHQUC_02530 [Chlamydiales bacterium]
MIKQLDRFFRTPLEHLGSAAKDSPYIFEDDQIKSLHFDALAIQSSMRKDQPFDLQLSYTQTMMGFLLLRSIPRSILIVGLGGGSLSKYCYHHFPDCRITTVEIHEKVISLRNEFSIPPDDERFNIVHADGAKYVAAHRNSVDVILLDGYNARGLPRRLCSQRFYDQCFQALRINGVLVANLLKSDLRRRTYIDRLRRTFGNRVLKTRAENDDNYIGYAFKGEKMPSGEELSIRAVELQKNYTIDFILMVTRIRAGMRSDRKLYG